MKKITKILTVSFIFLFCNLGSAQTIYVVNNNPGAPTGTNVYTTFTEAISIAAAGDIIYLVPSSISYGIITITKSITIFGAGLIPDKDLGVKSNVTDVNFDASDIRISGVIGTGVWSLGRFISNTSISGIVIENCRLPRLRRYTNSVPVGNLLLRNNVISTSSQYTLELQGVSTSVITNNLIMAGCCSSSYGITADGLTFSHNIFRASGTSGSDGITFNNVDNSLFEFNIFYGATQILPVGSINNTFNYNVSFGNSNNLFSSVGSNGNTGTGNIAGSDPKFTNLALGTDWSDSFDFTLDATSPALDINGGGTDAGVTGGSTPWDSDGSLLPTVQTVTIPSVVPVGQDLNVNVKGKGN